MIYRVIIFLIINFVALALVFFSFFKAYLWTVAESLQAKQFKELVYISTENKGYRANEHQPHSWSMVDRENLIDWMLSE